MTCYTAVGRDTLIYGGRTPGRTRSRSHSWKALVQAITAMTWPQMVAVRWTEVAGIKIQSGGNRQHLLLLSGCEKRRRLKKETTFLARGIGQTTLAFTRCEKPEEE